MSHRLKQGGSIDRSRVLTFKFNGRTLTANPGDTLASALLANGVRVVGRSLKYRRPRGIFGATVEDPNAMLAVQDGHGFDLAIRAGQVRIAEGLIVRTVTGWPGPGFDIGAVRRVAGRLLAAGFYYKTFMWPNWSWYEGSIKRLTGFGRPRNTRDNRPRAHRHATCDVLIVGGGPGGLAALDVLAGSGLDVVLADDQPEPGGCLRWEQAEIDGVPGERWAEQVLHRARTHGARILGSTTACGAYEGNFFTLVQSELDERGVRRECLWKLRAQHVVLATGAIERPIVFQNNDRPGVMLASAVRRYLAEYAVAAGRAVAVYTSNDSGYLTALAARRAGLAVPVVIDSRPEDAAAHADAVKAVGIPCLFEAEVVDTAGRTGVRAVTVSHGGARRVYRCDTLAVSGGWSPTIQLAAQRGIKPTYDAERAMFICADTPRGWQIVGGATGANTLCETLEGGYRAAAALIDAAATEPPQGRCEFGYGASFPTWRARNGRPDKMWVDHQKDVKLSDLDLAVRENYRSVEHLKRYTTLGMGTDQGRTSNVNGLGLLADLTGRAVGELGTTTFRPPYVAMPMGAIAHHRQSDLYRPRRYLPGHDVHVSHQAVFDDLGWERPDWFGANGEGRESAVHHEMAAVRETVGIFDASPIGRIEVSGPDAREFVNRFYVSNLKTLRAGRIRYSVMLHEDGSIFDDGVVICLSDAHFLLHPTSGHADAVAAWLEQWRQLEWPHLRVAVTPVTSQWAAIAIAGPRARDLLRALKPECDLSPEGLPHMAFVQGRMAGVEARVARVSFTGELQFEISVASRYGASLLEAALEAGQSLGGRPVGMEAWLRLRLEKGYIHVGADTDARTTPLAIGMGRVAAKKPYAFIGRRSLSMRFATGDERQRLVGLRARDSALAAGGRILAPGVTRPPGPTVGYVTSACTSPSVGHIGLALVEARFAEGNDKACVYDDGRIVEAEVTSPTFLDPDNRRLHA